MKLNHGYTMHGIEYYFAEDGRFFVTKSLSGGRYLLHKKKKDNPSTYDLMFKKDSLEECESAIERYLAIEKFANYRVNGWSI